MNRLASKNLANALVLISLIYLIAAMVWPQGKLLDSPAFTGLGLLFFLNLTACTLQQALAKPKGRFLGLPVLHIGLLVLLMGLAFNYLGGGEGHRYLSVGQETPLTARDFRGWKGGPLAKNWDSGHTIQLAGAELEMKNNEVYLKSGTIRYWNRAGESGQSTISFLLPIELAGARLRVQERGFAPVLDWGNELVHWKLLTVRHGEKTENYREKLNKAGFELEGEYFPAGADGRQGRLSIRVKGPDLQRTYALQPGDSFQLGGQRVIWQDTGYWLLISVHVEPGLPLIWFSSVLIIGGSAGYYLPLSWKRERNV